MTGDYILTLDLSNGRVHKRFHSAHGYQGLEICNLDQAGSFQEISEAEYEAMPADVRCRNCLAEDDGSTWSEPVP